MILTPDQAEKYESYVPSKATYEAVEIVVESVMQDYLDKLPPGVSPEPFEKDLAASIHLAIMSFKEILGLVLRHHKEECK